MNEDAQFPYPFVICKSGTFSPEAVDRLVAQIDALLDALREIEREGTTRITPFNPNVGSYLKLTKEAQIARAALEAASQENPHAARLEKARDALCRIADDYVWNPTPEAMENLRDARGEWQSAVGLYRLAASQETTK